MIIFGTRGITSTKGRGEFHCPACDNRSVRATRAAKHQGSLLAISVSALILAMLPACVSRIEKQLGVYGDWTAYVLRDGEFQVCYAETPFKPAPGADQKFSDMRLQVTNRSIDGDSDLIRFRALDKQPAHLTEVDFSSTEYQSALLLSQNIAEDRSHYWSPEAVKAMKSGESIQIVMQDDNGASFKTSIIGAYSLHGFVQAYDVISRTCPVRRAHVEPSPIMLSEVSIVRRTPLQFKFSLTGPFFESSKAEKLSIRGVPGLLSDEDLVEAENDFKADFFHHPYWADDLELYRNETPVGAIEGNQTIDFFGACLHTETGRLKILMETWVGGNNSPTITESVYFDPGVGIVSDTLYYFRGPRPFNCLANEQPWGWGEQFMPCQCTGFTTDKAYFSILDKLVSDINKAGNATEDTQGGIDEDAFAALLSRASRIQPFLWWDSTTSLDIQQFESSKFSIVAITWLSNADFHASFQLIFARRLTDKAWTLVYRADHVVENSKGFNKATVHGFHDDEHLDLYMCVEDCNWWGYYDRVHKNVADWLQDTAGGRS